jgi:hypothetical protein
MRISESITQLAPWRPAVNLETADLQRTLDLRFEVVMRALLEVRRLVNGKLALGFPDEALLNGQPDNLHVSWVRVVLDGAGDLGVATTVTHNLNLPVTVVATGNRPNVCWMPARWLYGDLTGANPAPLAPPANPGLTVLFRMGDTVTANAIDLRFYSALVPIATEPITVDLLMTPAVQ